MDVQTLPGARESEIVLDGKQRNCGTLLFVLVLHFNDIFIVVDIVAVGADWTMYL